MLRKLLSAVGIGNSHASGNESAGALPYKAPGANQSYNLAFCDDPSAFAPREGQSAAAWQKIVFANPLDLEALMALAADVSQEGRARYLATQLLRSAGKSVVPKQLFGVIVEMPLEGGLDTLAAYSDGSVRYINHTGKMTLAEAGSGLDGHVRELFAVSRPVVNAIGPWAKPRRPPPVLGNVRLSFLVSDGLCFGEGGLPVMQREPMAAPVIARATELLQAVVAKSVQ